MNTKELLSLVFGLGYTIAIPIVLFALGGRLLDDKMHTSPLFLLLGILLAIISSGYLVIKQIQRLNSK